MLYRRTILVHCSRPFSITLVVNPVLEVRYSTALYARPLDLTWPDKNRIYQCIKPDGVCCVCEPLGLKCLVWSYTDCYIIMKKYHSFNISTAVDYYTDYFNWNTKLLNKEKIVSAHTCITSCTGMAGCLTALP
jgi:hypothetical protein